MDSQIPISPTDLNEIVYNVARDVLEQQAIDGRIEEITEEVSNKILDDVVYVIERYMYYINSLMDTAKLNQAKQMFENQLDFE